MNNQTVPDPIPEPVVPVTPVVEPKSKSSPILIVVLILLLLLSLGSTAFLYYQNMWLKNMLTSYQTQPKVSPTPATYQSPVPTTTTDETANWKTYTDKKFGFSLQYPPSANTASRDPDPFPVAIQIENLKPRTGGGGGPEVEGWLMIVSETQSNNDNFSLRQWVQKFLPNNISADVNATPILDTTVGNQQAIRWETTGGDAHLLNYLVKRQNGVTLVTVNDTTEKNTEVINQILSTFKFTN